MVSKNELEFVILTQMNTIFALESKKSLSPVAISHRVTLISTNVLSMIRNELKFQTSFYIEFSFSEKSELKKGRKMATSSSTMER